MTTEKPTIEELVLAVESAKASVDHYGTTRDFRYDGCRADLAEARLALSKRLHADLREGIIELMWNPAMPAKAKEAIASLLARTKEPAAEPQGKEE